MSSVHKKRILIVDDERAIRRFLRIALDQNYSVIEAENGQEGLQLAASGRPDLVILDLGLPDMHGIEVLTRLREWTQIPVIIVSVRESDRDKVTALDAGADDYLTKPFSIEELFARIRAALRNHADFESQPIFKNGSLVIDLALRSVKVNDQPVALTPTEYEIIRVLVKNAGKVLTHSQLIMAVWTGNYEANSHLLRVNISNLRRKIESNPLLPCHILTEPGVGYRLQEIETKK
ncbi:MAG: response regulator [Chloroflexota bacterium]